MPTSSHQILCRIQGLKSAKGQKLNGLAASFDPTTPLSSDGRLAVTIDGVPAELAIKPENLYLFDQPFKDLAVAVGRQDLRSEQFMATVVDQKRGERATAQMLPADGTALRSRGTLAALAEYFQKKRLPRGKDIVVHVTDLNLARLLNSYSVDKNVAMKLDSKQQPIAAKVGKHLIKHNGALLFKYTPFRIHRGDRPADKRLQAVFDAKFHIYPCPCDTFLDALEVRLVLPGISTHEFFLDFGQDETVQYARNVYSMKELDRLKPEVLSDVDPQMFWSSVLHSKVLVKELKNLNCPNDVIKEWSNIYSCYLKTVIAFKEMMFSASEAVRLLPDANGNWNLMNDKIHRTVATRNAELAIVMSVEWGMEDSRYHQSIQLRDNYKGTEIDRVVAQLTRAFHSSDPQDLEIALTQIMTWKVTKACDCCGKKKKEFMECARCQGANYCNRECQLEAWPTHRKVCKELKKSRRKSDSEKKPPRKVGMYDPTEQTNHQGPIILSETCGLGFLRIFRFTQFCNVQNALSFKAMKNDTIFKTEVNALGGLDGGPRDVAGLSAMMLDSHDVKVFDSDLSNLDPVTRLCLVCGPLPNLDMAKDTLVDALHQVQGSATNLKMKWVGFTPLEWAAKKGQQSIVEWLVTEPRTSSLIEVGSPVGWACYTDRVEIARFLVDKGTSPNATNEIFWDSRPPLLAAAENGHLEAVKFLVEECGVSIATEWRGHDIFEHIEMAPTWKEQKGYRAVCKYAKRKLEG